MVFATAPTARSSHTLRASPLPHTAAHRAGTASPSRISGRLPSSTISGIRQPNARSRTGPSASISAAARRSSLPASSSARTSSRAAAGPAGVARAARSRARRAVARGVPGVQVGTARGQNQAVGSSPRARRTASRAQASAASWNQTAAARGAVGCAACTAVGVSSRRRCSSCRATVAGAASAGMTPRSTARTRSSRPASAQGREAVRRASSTRKAPRPIQPSSGADSASVRMRRSAITWRSPPGRR